MSEEQLSYKVQFDVIKESNNIKRLDTLEKLKLIERLQKMENIQKSNGRLEMKKFMFQLQQRIFDIPNQNNTNFRQQAEKSVEKLKRDSRLSQSPDSRMTTADKPKEFKDIEVKAFQP